MRFHSTPLPAQHAHAQFTAAAGEGEHATQHSHQHGDRCGSLFVAISSTQ